MDKDRYYFFETDNYECVFCINEEKYIKKYIYTKIIHPFSNEVVGVWKSTSWTYKSIKGCKEITEEEAFVEFL